MPRSEPQDQPNPDGRPSVPRRVLPPSLLLLGLLAPTALAAVERHEWREEGFQAAVDQAARGRRLVALLVTQPDWCPPCIQLNAKWLDNAEDRAVSPLLEDAMILEVLGYDPPGAALLRAQGLQFQGTPSLLVFRPSVPGRRLGEAELLGSVVGAPADYAQRLRRIVEGEDPVEGLQARLRTERRPMERARLARELADLLVARGDGAGAARALREVREVRRLARGLSPEQAEELDGLVREAEWTRAAEVELRVEEDLQTALDGIDAWISRHGREARDPRELAYARAWALAQLGRIDEARAEMTRAFLQPGDEDLDTFGYFAFRIGDAGLLEDAESRLRAALVAVGASGEAGAAADLHGSLGRVLRKQGRFREALSSFDRAVALSEGDARVVWQGQRDWCRGELEAAGAS